MAKNNEGPKAIVIPTGGTVEEDLERAEAAIECNRMYKIENGREVPYILSGVGPDTNVALGHIKSSGKRKPNFHRELYDYMEYMSDGPLGLDIRSVDSIGNILNTFPPGVSGTYAIPSYPVHLDRFELIIEKAREEGEISMDVEFEFIPTDQTFKQWGYGVAANVKERWRLRKGISKAREHKTGQFGNFVKKIISGP